MRIAYLDCFAGIAGDMFLGALLDAGCPRRVLEQAVDALNIGARLHIEQVDRSGITATKVHVLENGRPAEHGTHGAAHTHSHGAAPSNSAQATHPPSPFPEQEKLEQPIHTHYPGTQHLHKPGHSHSHEHDQPPRDHKHDHGHEHHHPHEHEQEHPHEHAHPHIHGRSLSEIRALIQAASLDEPVKRTALEAFILLGHAEAKIHNVPVDQIHFHEVGAVDAIVDIVATSAGIHHLGVERWYCSAVNVGGGTVDCAHGRFPVPAPATADLLRGVPTYSAHVEKELVTPTGAALLRAIEPVFGSQPLMRVEGIGYGAGSRNPHHFPNVLRLSIGEADEAAATSASVPAATTSGHRHRAEESSGHHHHHEAGTVTVLETALDDLSPQVLAYVAESALSAGALDVMLTPVIMKKGRPGTLLTVLCNPADSAALQDLMIRETSTLGVRIREDRRACLERSHTPVETAFGTIRVKIGSSEGEERNAAPEFEDCRAAASEHHVPLKQVQQAAIAAYLSRAEQRSRG